MKELPLWIAYLFSIGWAMAFSPARPDPLSELHRWKAQPELRQELLHVGDIDTEGVIWFAGKSSLLAYDGHAVTHHNFPDTWLDMGAGKDLLCAQNGTIYVLYQKALIRFHPSDGFDLLRSMKESADASTSLVQTADGSVWFGGGDGLYRIKSGGPEPVETGLGSIRAIQVDLKGDLWVANDSNEIGVFAYNPTGGDYLKLVDRISLPKDLQGSNSHLYRKPDGTMWILITDPAWAVIEFAADVRIDRIPVPNGFESAIGFNYCPMPDGRIIFTEKSTTAQYYNRKWTLLDLDDYPVATHESFAIALPGNRLLIGGSHTQRYLIDLSDERWSTYRDLVFCDEDPHGREWFIGKDRRVFVHDSRNDSWLILTEAEGLIDSPNSIHVASNGIVWVSGMHKHVAALSYLRDGRWQRHDFPSIGYTFGHLAVCELPDGRLIFGNNSDRYFDARPGGVVLCRTIKDGIVMEAISGPHYPERSYCITAWRGNGFWIGGRNLFFKSGPESPELILNDRFQRSWIDHMIVDRHGILWIANWRLGLFRFDGKDWEEIRAGDDPSGIHASFIFAGKNQKGIWIGSPEGLHRFDGATWSQCVLGDQFRFSKEGGSMVENKAGDIWLNFSYRDWFLNSPMSHDAQAHAVRTIRYRADRQSPETAFTRRENELKGPGNAFFSWIGRDRWEDTPRSELEFSYRLSGRNWTPFSKQSDVVLLDLPSGEYTIEVRARDRDFNVDPTPAIASFRVIPPLWRQPWFIAVLAGVFVSTALLISIIVRQRIKYAVALSEFRIEFFTNLSHELRTPLSVILGPLQRLIEHAGSLRDRESLEMIQRNANKMLGLVNQLLEFRKVELGKLEFHPSSGEVIGFVKEAIYSLSPLWEQKKQNVQIDLDQEPFRCDFDPDKLIRITDNLLSNAVKYTPDGGTIKVNVRVENKSGNQPLLRLRVEDSGIGIPKAEIKRVTEPFYMVHNGPSGGSGSGIGLALVKEMVNLWNGRMSIESRTSGPHKGTCIEVSLPLLPASTKRDQDSLTESPIDNESGEAGDSIQPPSHGQRKRILVIEDNPDLRSFLESELKIHYEVETAENGLTGIDRSLVHPPDLILSDVMMPEMNGLELCRKIRETEDICHIPIILLTAQTGESHYVEGIESGADEYFNKPISIPKLIVRIENLLQSRQRLHEVFAEQVVLEPSKIAVLPTDQLFLQNAIRIAEDNMQTEDFDVEAFAAKLAVSRATLNRKIKSITGTSPKAFVRSMRIKRAAYLLAESDLPINEIFFKVGFYDASNFSRVFKKEFGVTPSQYRDQHQLPKGSANVE